MELHLQFHCLTTAMPKMCTYCPHHPVLSNSADKILWELSSVHRQTQVKQQTGNASWCFMQTFSFGQLPACQVNVCLRAVLLTARLKDSEQNCEKQVSVYVHIYIHIHIFYVFLRHTSDRHQYKNYHLQFHWLELWIPITNVNNTNINVINKL